MGNPDDSLKRKLTASGATIGLKTAAAREVNVEALTKESAADAAELKEKLAREPGHAHAIALKASNVARRTRTKAPRRPASALRPVLAPYADTRQAVISTPPTLRECEVRWWRGYVKSQLVAVTTDMTGTATAVASSPYFREKGRGRAESPVAAAALHALVESLEREGWRSIGRGDEWFSVRFAGGNEPLLPRER